MDDVRISEIREDLPFGARVWGVTRENLKNPDIRRKLNEVFDDRGVLVFEEVEQSSLMQIGLSEVFGRLKGHPVASMARAAEDLAPGVIDLNSDPNDDIGLAEVDGKVVHNWLPWHFDHSYNDQLNRAGVLRPIQIPPEGGFTGFADGVDLHQRLPTDLRDRIEGKNVIYTLDVLIKNQKFAVPDNLREIRTAQSHIELEKVSNRQPRAIHPAVWTRATGEKVLHVGPFHAVGIEGEETPEGDALLLEVCRFVRENPVVYYHQWNMGQMLIWDNWRLLHCVTGADPKYQRRMHRTTIEGDYGLGRFEGERVPREQLERT